MKTHKGNIIVLTGPSGSGKSSLTKALFEAFDDLHFSVSCTTRKPREGEIDGVHYYFVSHEQFLQDIQAEKFVEYAQVYNNFYGTTKAEIEKGINAGRSIVLDVDIQGEARIKSLYQDHVCSIFITTPTRSELKRRLENRGSDDAESLNRRLAYATTEIAEICRFDYLVVNDNLEDSVKQLVAIVGSLKVRARCYDLEDFAKKWQDS